MQKFVLTILASFAVSTATATDRVSEIAEAWARAYRDLHERPEYHYRCTVSATHVKPDVDLGLDLVTNRQFAIEIFRLGKSVRSNSILRPDFADFATLGWIQVFDGRAAYVVQCEGRDYSVYSTRFDIDKLTSMGQPFMDPLADALGLSACAAIRMGRASPDTFDVAAALKSGTYRMTADNGRTVAVAMEGTDELVLSREHDYAIEQRTWWWGGYHPIKCVIVNSDWKQFADGQWYPSRSETAYFQAPGTSSGDPCVKVTYRFFAMAPSTAEVFELVADRPGWTVTLFSPYREAQHTTVQRGEAIILSQVANGGLSLRAAVQSADVREIRSQVRRELIAVILIVITLIATMDILCNNRKLRAQS